MTTRQLLFWGGVAAAGAAAVYIYNQSQTKEKVKSGPQLTKEYLLVILKEIQREMQTPLSELAAMSQQLRAQTRGSVPDRELEMYLVHQGPFASHMKQIEEAIYSKHEVTEAVVKKATKYYDSDDEIAAITTSMRKMYADALKGSMPSLPTVDLPEIMTPELTLSIFQKIMNGIETEVAKLVKAARAAGKNPRDPSFSEQVQSQLDVTSIRTKALADSGLTGFKESPQEIFRSALQKYAEDPTFALMIRSQSEMHEKKLQDLLKLTDEEEKGLLKRIKKIESDEQYKQVMAELATQDKLVVVDFWAVWCGPCLQLGPVVADLSEEFPSVEFLRVDLDLAEKTSEEVGLRMMPTFGLFRNGEKLELVEGPDAQLLKRRIEAQLEPTIVAL